MRKAMMVLALVIFSAVMFSVPYVKAADSSPYLDGVVRWERIFYSEVIMMSDTFSSVGMLYFYVKVKGGHGRVYIVTAEERHVLFASGISFPPQRGETFYLANFDVWKKNGKVVLYKFFSRKPIPADLKGALRSVNDF